MGWKIVARRLGPAGGPRQRLARQRAWDRAHGPDAWAVGVLVDGDVVPYEQALRDVYQRSDDAFLDAHPDEVDRLVSTAARLRDPHAEAIGGVDLQVPAILDHLRRRGRPLAGDDAVDLGSCTDASHPISVRLSPLTIPAAPDPRLSLERFWQTCERLAIWTDPHEGEAQG